jgi:hypothetical protein
VLERTNRRVRIRAEGTLTAYSVRSPFRYACEYTVLGSGDVLLETAIDPLQPELPPIPRFGLEMHLPEDFEEFAWLGRGPHESYVDMKQSARIDQYRSTVAGEYVPRIMPQEHGNHADCFWASVTTARGLGVLAVGMPTLNVSASHFTPGDLTEARHTYDLTPCAETVLHLDHAQHGLGSQSCGPAPEKHYRLNARPMAFAVRLKAFCAETISAAQLARRVIE